MKNAREYYRKFSWSRYQRDVFAEVVQGDRHIAVEAVAGSGKTSTLKGIVHWLPSAFKIRIFAFNKSVADKLERELPGRVKVGTAHSYGYAMCMGATGSYDGGLTVDNDKYWKLAGAAIRRLVREAEEAASTPLSTSDAGTKFRFPNLRDEKVVSALLHGIHEACHIIRVALPVFKFQSVKEALSSYGVNIPGQLRYWVVRLAMDCITQGNQQASEHAIVDFDDMLWLPHLWKLRPLSIPNICMVDEVQDTNAAMQSLYKKFGDAGTRMIFVGDSRQSIYGFSGAMPDAFPKIKEEFDCVELPLPVSYRCPTSHIELAKQIVPQIEARPGASKGVMQTVDQEFFYENAQPNNLVLSRMTAPLVRCCIDLVFGGKKAQIRGEDIAEGLCTTARNICGNHPMPRFEYELSEWQQREMRQAGDDELAIDNAIDTAHALQACYDAFGNQCATIERFCDRIREMFSPNDVSDCITLSTIHRAKGDEARVVWLLESDKLPPDREDWNQAQQEENLVYVAITRAIETLYFVPSADVYDNVGGISILKDIDWNACAGDRQEARRHTSTSPFDFAQHKLSDQEAVQISLL